MVSLSWRKRDESNRMLLTPSSSSKRSFFRKGKSSSKDLRSDQVGRGEKRSTREGWPGARISGRSPRTPPMTPEQDDNMYCAPVSNVTVGKSPTNSAHKEIHLPKSKTKKAKEANRAASPDDQTEYSDLTDNRTLKRLNEQKAAYEEALREAEKRKKAMAAAAVNANNDNNSSSRSGDPSAAHRTLGSHPPERSFLGDILGMMDGACKPNDPPAIENVKSYTPEWGMAPSMDQTDARSPARSRGIDPAEQMTNIEEEDDDDDLFEDLEDQKEPSVESSPRTTHENFEMVLEELNDDNAPKKRDWMKRFGRKKSDSQEEQPVDASRSHKDLVKQALFPELAEGTTEMEELRKQEKQEQARQAPPPPPAGQKKSKRGIFKSFRRLNSKKNVRTLDTVEEEPNSSTPPRANKATPRQHMQHPVQKQVVDDIYRDLLNEDTRKAEESREGSYTDQEYSRATYSQSDYSGQHTSDGSSNNNQAGVLGGFMAMISETVGLTGEVNKMDDHPNNKGIPQSKSWRGPANHEDSTAESLQTPTDLKRSNSAPKNVQTNSFKRKKPIWKEVTDPKTGRSYYYHRKTRETTWVRPKEMDMPVEEDNAQAPDRQGQSIREDPSLRKASERDFDRTVWDQKQEIARLLQTMAPPDGASVDDLLAQYEGREDELLARVKKMKESRPFDEPIARETNDDEEEEAERGDVVAELSYHDNASELNHSMLSGNGFSRSRSGVTSKQSESTQQMANTSSRYGARKLDDTTAGGTSLSSHGVAAATSVHRVPSKIPVRVRSRELMVEDFSSDRFKSEIYNNERPSNYSSMRMSRPFMSTGYRAPPIVEENENDAESSHGVTDSVSALSMNEMEFVGGKGGMDEARRRALDDAIHREDWDMAAAISEGMKALKQNNERSKPLSDHQEWQQSELDKFISENDWEAVSEYIAELRSRSLERAIEESPMPVEEPILEKQRDGPIEFSDDETPQDSSKGRDLRYGESYSSEDSSSYYSYSSSGSSSPAPRRRKSSSKPSSTQRRRTRSRRRELSRRKEREFAC